jgi:Flp pilus assembly secretin CpaC
MADTMRTTLTAPLLAVIALVGFAISPHRALAADAALPPALGIHITSSDETAIFVPMVVSKALVIDLPSDIKDVLVSSPEIVKAFVRSQRRAYLTAIAVGQANVFFFDAEGRQIGALDVSVRTRQAPAPFIGKSGPEIAVTVFRGHTGYSVPLLCTHTNCVVPSGPAKSEAKDDVDLTVDVGDVAKK